MRHRLIPRSRRALEEEMAVFLPGKSYGQRSLVGYRSWGRDRKIRHDLSTKHTHTHTTKVNSVYYRKSTDGVYKAWGLWCPTKGAVLQLKPQKQRPCCRCRVT